MFGRSATNKPIAQPGEICPLMRQDVSKVCHHCKFYVGLEVTDNQTKQKSMVYECMHVAQGQVLAGMVNSLNAMVQKIDGQGAAIESLRNNIVEIAARDQRQTAAALLTKMAALEGQAMLSKPNN